MKEDANNYHPTTLIPTLPKILEKLTANHVFSFIKKHNKNKI
jgi:hypothetical protein